MNREIQVNVPPQTMLQYLEEYFDGKPVKSSILGFKYKFTILDANQQKFRLRKVPFGTASWVVAKIRGSENSNIQISLRPLFYLQMFVGNILFIAFLIYSGDTGFGWIVLLIMNVMAVVGFLREYKFWADTIEHAARSCEQDF